MTLHSPAPARDLNRADVEAELTKLLRHGYGLLTVKVHGHRISALDITVRQTWLTCNGQVSETPASQNG